MNKVFKNFLSVGLISAISGGVAVASYIYMNNEKPSVITSTTFQQPVRLASYSSAPAEKTDFTAAAENSVHAVVHIKSVQKPKAVNRQQQQMPQNNPFFFFFGDGGFERPQQQPRVGSGSGVIISTDGYILTNNHVIDGADELQVTLNDNRNFTATVVGADPATDIALLKIEAADLPVIPFGDSDKLKVGEWVLAVGNPFNLTSTVTAGIVSAKGRGLQMGSRNGNDLKIESFIQTDAAVNPGNSGGALVNTKGELIGINTAIYSETGNFAGYSFAVPISIASKVASDLKQFGVVQRAMLGVMMTDVTPELAKQKDIKALEGAYVAEFADRSSAKEAGMEVGDVIIAVDGNKVKSGSQLQEQISRFRPGDKVNIDVQRGDKVKTLTVELKNSKGNTEVVQVQDGKIKLGAELKALSQDQMRKYGINYGVEVVGVKDGKFKRAGINKGFIIMVINGNRITSPSDIEAILESVRTGNSDEQGLFIKGFYPNGRTEYYAINLAD